MTRKGIFGTTLSLVLAGLIAAPAAGQTQNDVELGPLVVSPTRSEQPLEDAPGTTTVITREDIERKGYRTLSEALASVPAVRPVASGAIGAQTSVFVRGTNSNHVLVLIDGQRAVADPSSPGGAFNFAHYNLDAVERIEILRGPLAALYGSQALGGVINIITKKGDRDTTYRLFAEGGTRETANTRAGVSGTVEAMSFDLSAGYFYSEGQSVISKRYRGGVEAEDDAYERASASGRLDFDLSKYLDLTVFAQVVDSYRETDPGGEDPDADEKGVLLDSYAALQGRFFDGIYRPSLRVGYDYNRRADKDVPDGFDAFTPFGTVTTSDTTRVGEIFSLGTEHQVDIGADNTLTVGAEFLNETLESRGFNDFSGFTIVEFTDAAQDRGSLYIQDTHRFGEYFSLTAGVRHDMVENFEDHTTWNVSPVATIDETGTTLKGSVGTGFRVPSLFERFGRTGNAFGNVFVGNPNLKPEISFGWEAGIEQELFDGMLRGGATYFSTDIEDAVNQVGFPATTVNNVDLEIEGVETFLAFDPFEWLQLSATYTYTDAINETTGKQALRRPKHKITGDATLFVEEGYLTVSLVRESNIRDIRFIGGAINLAPRTVVNLAGGYEVMDGVELFGRVENLFDEEYDVSDGFQGPRFEAFLGFRVTLD